MKRILLSLAALLLLTGGTAQAVPGFEPDQRRFDLLIRVADDAGNRFTDTTRFDPATGWDFGDRDGYFCAWVEHFSDRLDFTVHYARVTTESGGYGNFRQINDRNGVEGQQGRCGREDATANANGPIAPGFVCGDICLATYNDEDHFAHGVSLVFYRDGAEFDRIDYPAMCGQMYWTDGDEPGEVILWWDEDGAADTMPGMSDCPGGPGEPVPVVRAMVLDLAPGVGVCTEGSDGMKQCSFDETEPEPAPEPMPSPTSTDPRCVEHPDDPRC